MKKCSLILSMLALVMLACISCNGKNGNGAAGEGNSNITAESFSPSDIDWNVIREFRDNRENLVYSENPVEYTANMDSCLIQYRILSLGIAQEGSTVKLVNALKQKYPAEDVDEATMFIAAMDGFVQYAKLTPDWENSTELPNELLPLSAEQLKEAIEIKKLQKK